MTADRWIVTAIGLALIAFIVWFFWLKRSTGFRASETTGGYQEAMILVKGGYTPDTIIVRSGRPVRLNFRREETASCSDKVIFADFQKSAELPTGQTVAVEFLPKEPGEFGFACPMGMFRVGEPRCGRTIIWIATIIRRAAS
jgi:plastocyanin domain-containing protein